MTRTALFNTETGIVENIIEVSTDANWQPDEGFSIRPSDTAQVGWLFDGDNFNAPPIDQEKLISDTRSQRDNLLAATDWTQVADAPVDQAAWAVYRQALRDVPAQAGFPDNVTWPTKP